ncbi:MAG TPA: hypothetical protein VH599_03155 [Ktedonobacterales bacterium]|jgi:hypothetical protein
MRKKPGYRELCFYLTEEHYAALERYWRYQTTDRHITTTAVALLVEALQTHQQHPPPAQKSEQ